MKTHTYLILGLIILSLVIPLHASAEQQLKVIFKLYDADNKPLRLVNGRAEIIPGKCPDISYKVNNSTLVLRVPSKCNVSAWTLIYYGKGGTGKIFYGIKILNTTWINNTTVTIEGKVNIKPLLIRVVSAKGVGLPGAWISIKDPTFIYEDAYTNATGYAWIDLLPGKTYWGDIKLYIYWPPPGILEKRKPLSILKTSNLVNYTNYTITTSYNLSATNTVKIVTLDNKPAPWLWVGICKKKYLILEHNNTINVSLKEIASCKVLKIYRISLKDPLPYGGALTYDLVNIAEKGVLRINAKYVRVYTNKPVVKAKLILEPYINEPSLTINLENGSLVPLVIAKDTVRLELLEPNTTVWTEGVSGIIELETTKKSTLKITITGFEPGKTSIAVSVNKGRSWTSVTPKLRALPGDKWVISAKIGTGFLLEPIEQGTLLDIKGVIYDYNRTKFIAFWVRGVHPYKMLLLGSETTTTATTIKPTTSTTTTTPSTTQTTTISTYTSPKTIESSTPLTPIVPLNTTAASTTTIQQERGFPWWIIVVVILVVIAVMIVILIAKKKQRQEKQ